MVLRLIDSAEDRIDRTGKDSISLKMLEDLPLDMDGKLSGFIDAENESGLFQNKQGFFIHRRYYD